MAYSPKERHTLRNILNILSQRKGTTLRIIPPCFSQRRAPLCASFPPLFHEERAPLCASFPPILPKNGHNSAQNSFSFPIEWAPLRAEFSPLPGYTSGCVPGRYVHQGIPQGVVGRVCTPGYIPQGVVGCILGYMPPYMPPYYATRVHTTLYTPLYHPGYTTLPLPSPLVVHASDDVAG